MDPIINKVASSGLVTLDLEEHFPEGERVLFDLEPWLFQGLILREKAKKIIFGDLKRLEEEIFEDVIASINAEDYRDQRVIIKGCSKREIPLFTYAALTAKLRPVVKSIMFGEPCSTVPVFKRKD